jgi:hypothetical protein
MVIPLFYQTRPASIPIDGSVHGFSVPRVYDELVISFGLVAYATTATCST